MGVDHHRHLAGDRAVTFHVIVVSTSRAAETDETGPMLEARLVEAGHRVTGREILPDDPQMVRERLSGIQEEGRAEVVFFSGGTGLSRRDRTYEAVTDLLDVHIPGFGELYRRLSYDEIGTAAMLSRATAGVMGDLLVFSVPGSPNGALMALERLVLPEVRHMLYELGKEPALEPPGEEPEPKPTPLPTPPITTGAGWEAAVESLQGEIRRGMWPTISEPPGHLAPVRNVLEAAGQRATLVLPDGSTHGLFGFPDLVRGSAKVLLVGPGEPWGSVVALHRFPRPAGLACATGLGGIPPVDADVKEVCAELTGRPSPGAGTLFAVDGSTVFILQDGRVRSWDGRRERDEGPAGSVISSLVLRWSNR